MFFWEKLTRSGNVGKAFHIHSMREVVFLQYTVSAILNTGSTLLSALRGGLVTWFYLTVRHVTYSQLISTGSSVCCRPSFSTAVFLAIFIRCVAFPPISLTMASQSQGIQQLLQAEKRAAEKVAEARKRKLFLRMLYDSESNKRIDSKLS